MKLIPHISAVSAELRKILESKDNSLEKEYLSTIYISLWDFNEKWYIENNPDLQAAIPSDTFPTGWHHFKAVGYFEGRLPIAPNIDESWYLTTYPDVATAIIKGVFLSAEEHFKDSGYAEGRVPADPGIELDWYAPRFMHFDTGQPIDEKTCVDHFVTVGYLSGAIPAPPK